MTENNQDTGFSYTYSAREQEEIRRIREIYSPSDRAPEDKMARLRRLDRGATQKARVVSLVLGVIGALVLGFGMSLIMSELAAMLGMGQLVAMLVGVGVGVMGTALVAVAYPVYTLVLRLERKKIAPEIIRLTDELIK